MSTLYKLYHKKNQLCKLVPFSHSIALAQSSIKLSTPEKFPSLTLTQLQPEAKTRTTRTKSKFLSALMSPKSHSPDTGSFDKSQRFLMESFSSQPISKQNSALLNENAKLKKEIQVLKNEKENLVSIFNRLEKEYANTSPCNKYNERRYVILKSMLEQKDKYISLLKETTKGLQNLWKSSHEIILDVWRYIKKKQVLAERIEIDIVHDFSKETRKASKKETALEKELKEVIQRFDNRIKGAISEYWKQYSLHLTSKKSLKEQQTIIRNHVGLVIEKSRTDYNETVHSLDSFEFNKERLLKLETNLSMLLNSLLEKQNDSLTIKDGTPIKDLKSILQFSSMLRENAESILDLALSSALVSPKKASLRLNPFYPVFVKAKCYMNKVIDESYQDLSINPSTINRICSISLNDEPKELRKKKMIEEFMKLRDHELALVLDKHLHSCENKHLHEIIYGLLKTLENLEATIERAFQELAGNFKGQLLTKLQDIIELNSEMRATKDVLTKRRNKEKLETLLKELLKFVKNSYKVITVKQVKDTLLKQIQELSNTKLIITKAFSHK